MPGRLARWYLIEGHPGSTAGGVAVDADEWVACTAVTLWGARRTVRAAEPSWWLRPVRRRDWEAEH